jgi:hypothetical protein
MHAAGGRVRRPAPTTTSKEIRMAAEHGHDHDHDHDHGHDHSHGADGDLARIQAIRDEGVHRANEHEGPFSLHVVGLGQTGAEVIAQLLRNRPEGFLEDPGTRFSALAVDIGDQDVKAVREAASGLPADRAHVRTVAMEAPTRDALLGDLRRYREFLKMEYPRYYWNPNYEPWLPSDTEVPSAGGHFPRAVAKAIYGTEYYQDGEVAKELEAFAQSVDASKSTPIVVVVFSMAGGTGSGIVVDLARHLSSIKLGRRPWVVGIGVMPCEGDDASTRDGRLFPVINELDCMVDTEKNKGVMAVWGDLYKNPFTGGFFAVPQDDVHAITRDLAATHEYVDAGIAGFLTRDGGVHLYETLKMLNWLSVPADRWHPAIRGEPNDRWINVLSVRRPADAGSLASIGVKAGAETGYAEVRMLGAGGADAAAVSAQVAKAVSTRVDPGVLELNSPGEPLLTLVVPRVSKLDLEAFVPSRETYDGLNWDEKLLMHSWILDLGVLLCEPSIRFDGMGGECIWGCACWVVVPHDLIRGEVKEAVGAA